MKRKLALIAVAAAGLVALLAPAGASAAVRCGLYYYDNPQAGIANQHFSHYRDLRGYGIKRVAQKELGRTYVFPTCWYIQQVVRAQSTPGAYMHQGNLFWYQEDGLPRWKHWIHVYFSSRVPAFRNDLGVWHYTWQKQNGGYPARFRAVNGAQVITFWVSSTADPINPGA